MVGISSLLFLVMGSWMTPLYIRHPMGAHSLNVLQSQFVGPVVSRDVFVNNLARSEDRQTYLCEWAYPKLTPREIEVLHWSAEGKTASEIAGILSLSQETVQTHIKNAVRKLQTTNKTAAAVRAVRMGLLY